MEHIWAPWRGEYVTTEKQDASCVFCAKLEGNSDRDNLILHRGHEVAVLMNLYPYNNGHLMVVPLRHTADIAALSSSELEEFYTLTVRMTKLLREVMQAGGVNIGINLGSAAGAGIAAHLHQHIVPRWAGDTNFMPVVAGTKVISEHMLKTYDKLKAALEAER